MESSVTETADDGRIAEESSSADASKERVVKKEQISKVEDNAAQGGPTIQPVFIDALNVQLHFDDFQYVEQTDGNDNEEGCNTDEENDSDDSEDSSCIQYSTEIKGSLLPINDGDDDCVPSSVEGQEYTELVPNFSPAGEQSDNTADNFAPADNPGSVSPPSSQGSMSSVDYLNSNVAQIEKNTKRFKETMDEKLKQMLPCFLNKKQFDLLRQYIVDGPFTLRQRDFLRNDCASYLSSSGKMHEDPGTCQGLLKALEMEETSILFSRFGKLLFDNFPEGRQPKSTKSYAEETAANPGTTQTGVGGLPTDQVGYEAAVHLQPPFKTDLSPPPVSHVDPFETTTTTICLQQKLDLAKKEVGGPRHSNTTAMLNRSPEDVLRYNSMLENAYDKILANKGSRIKQIEKAGQVLFEEVFSSEEIRDQQFGRRKGKPQYSDEKIRFINRSLCWLLKGPAKRSIEDFDKSIAAEDGRLSENDFETLKNLVFCQHAYRLRKRKSDQKVKSEAKKPKN